MIALSSESGRELWRYFRGYGGGASVQTDLTGATFVTGWRGFGQTIASSGTRISGIKLDEGTGSELWSNSIEGDVGDGVGALDAGGDLVVGGTRLSRQDNTWEFVVGKFSEASGVLQWVRTPFGATRGFQSAAAVCVDRVGSSVTAGTAFAGSNGRDFTLVKHSSAGEEMWHRAITGGGQMDDGALACVIDRSGNVIAAGYETQLSGDLDFVVVKLSGVTGEDFEPDAMTLLNLLVESVGDIDMPAGLRESLLAKLHAAALALEDPTGANGASVRGPLTALIREVEAQRGNKIAATDADGLVESARDILALLSGPA